MGRRGRIRRLREEDLEELLEQEEAAPEKAPAKAAQPETPVARVLDLQKTAGNRATGAALARWPFFGVASATAQWPKERQLILDGEALPLESVQEAVGRNATLGSPGPPTREADVKAAGEIFVTIKVGDWSTGLFKASMSGKSYKTVEIVLPGKDGRGVRWILTDVMISGYSTSSAGGDPVQTLTLNFKNREFSQSPPPPR
jgi:type VI secretion system secreted protein Hcp